MVAIAICLAGSVTMFAQNKATSPFDRENRHNDKSVFADKYPKVDFLKKSNSTLPVLRSGNFKQRLDSIVSSYDIEEFTMRRKQEFAYDNNGNCITEIGYDWENNAWAKSWKGEYSYDNKGNLTIEIYYDWEDNAWVEGWKHEYSYNNNGNITMRICYGWENNVWVKDWKGECSYNNNGNITMCIVYYWENNVWIERYRDKYEYSYDNNENETMEIWYAWEGNVWIESGKIEYSYDNNGNLTMVNFNNYQHTPMKEELSYDNNGNPTMSIFYSWENDTWVEYWKTEYEFDLSVLSSDISYFPYFFFDYFTVIEHCKTIEVKNKLIGIKSYGWYENITGVFYYSNIQGSNVGIEDTRRAASLPRIAGYYSLTGAKLVQEPERGMYIILYDNGTSERRVK